jgi:hypothetical protein
MTLVFTGYYSDGVERNLKVELNLEKGLPSEVTGPPDKIDQVISIRYIREAST